MLLWPASDFRVSSNIMIIKKSPVSQRRALVVGISNYDYSPPLANTLRDAVAISNELRKLDFHVEDYYDLDLNNFIAAINNFLENTSAQNLQKENDEGVIFVYFAGHGLQFGDKNYIVPKDFDPNSPLPLSQLLSIEFLLEAMNRVASRKILFLDACRDTGGLQIADGAYDTAVTPSHVERTFQHDNLGLVEHVSPKSYADRAMVTRSLASRQGFAVQSLGDLNQTFIAFAASPGETALDGPKGKHSPFAAGVLKYLRFRGLNVFDMCQAVARHVREETGGKQVPWTRSNLTDRFELHKATQRPAFIMLGLGLLAGSLSAVLNFDLLRFTDTGFAFGDGQLKYIFEHGSGNEVLLMVSGFMGLALAAGVFIWSEHRHNRYMQAVVAFAIYMAFAVVSRILFAPIVADKEQMRELGNMKADVLEELIFGNFIRDTSATFLITILFFAILAGALAGAGTVISGAAFHRELRRATRIVSGAVIGMSAPILFILFLIMRQHLASYLGWDPAGFSDGKVTDLEVISIIAVVALWYAAMAWNVGRAYARPYYDRI